LRPSTVAVCLTAAVLVLATGCAHQALAQRRLNARAAGIENTLSVYAERERLCPARLEEDAAYIRDDLALHAQRTAENAGKVGRFFADDVERWRTRQPDYRAEIDRILRGKPENFEWTAIILFY